MLTQTKYDLILAADVIYNVDTLPYLFSTLQMAISAKTLVLIAYQQRNPEAEAQFFSKLIDAGYDVVEVSLGTFQHTRRRPDCGLEPSVESLSELQWSYQRVYEIRLGSAKPQAQVLCTTNNTEGLFL